MNGKEIPKKRIGGVVLRAFFDFVGGKERLNRLGGYPFFSPGRDGLFSGAEGGFRLTKSGGGMVYYVSERKMKEFYQ